MSLGVKGGSADGGMTSLGGGERSISSETIAHSQVSVGGDSSANAKVTGIFQQRRSQLEKIGDFVCSYAVFARRFTIASAWNLVKFPLVFVPVFLGFGDSFAVHSKEPCDAVFKTSRLDRAKALVGNNPICMAVAANDYYGLKKLLEDGVSPNEFILHDAGDLNVRGLTALDLAQGGADGTKTRYKYTDYMRFVTREKSVADLLIEHGAKTSKGLGGLDQKVKDLVGDNKVLSAIVRKDLVGLVEALKTDPQAVNGVVPEDTTDESIKGCTAYDLISGAGKYKMEEFTELEKFCEGFEFSKEVNKMLEREVNDKWEGYVYSKPPEQVELFLEQKWETVRLDKEGEAIKEVSRNGYYNQDEMDINLYQKEKQVKLNSLKELKSSLKGLLIANMKKKLYEVNDVFKFALTGNTDELKELLNKDDSIDLNARVPNDFPDASVRGLRVLDLVLAEGPLVYATPEDKWKEVARLLESKGAKKSAKLRENSIQEFVGEIEGAGILTHIAMMDKEKLEGVLKSTEESGGLVAVYTLLKNTKLPDSLGLDLGDVSVLELLQNPEKEKAFEEAIAPKWADGFGSQDKDMIKQKMTDVFYKILASYENRFKEDQSCEDAGYKPIQKKSRGFKFAEGVKTEGTVGRAGLTGMGNRQNRQ